jgi:hypothetical protein
VTEVKRKEEENARYGQKEFPLQAEAVCIPLGKRVTAIADAVYNMLDSINFPCNLKMAAFIVHTSTGILNSLQGMDEPVYLAMDQIAYAVKLYGGPNP